MRDCHSGSNGIFSWIYLKCFSFLADRLYLSVAVNTIYLARFRGCRRLITICGKFAVVSRGIWQTSPQNLEKFTAENCGPYSLLLNVWYICSEHVIRLPCSTIVHRFCWVCNMHNFPLTCAKDICMYVCIHLCACRFSNSFIFLSHMPAWLSHIVYACRITVGI